jgi:hypothetical protein
MASISMFIATLSIIRRAAGSRMSIAAALILSARSSKSGEPCPCLMNPTSMCKTFSPPQIYAATMQLQLDKS